METDRIALGLAGVAVLAAIGLLVVGSGFAPWAETYGNGTVTVVDEDGTELATVDVEVADTPQERITGLSDHESLANGTGMLFVHGGEADRTYVMRRMDFPLDIVFVGADGEITAISHARAPREGEDGERLRHSGRAKYVLEVPRGYTNATGIAVGDRIEIEYDD